MNPRLYTTSYNKPQGQQFDTADDIARQLARINEQLAVKNRRSRRIWRTAAAVLIAVAVIYLLLIAVSIIAFDKFRVDDPGTAQVTDYVEVMPEKKK
ncbi:MAG: hypothetical protein BHW36_05645 [Firmicutes bacterium CAG:24053_14]|nr:MAG: hypothetical protein BHW36_05645 [Firmicutes bacterium CAG:24053_14]